MVRDHVFRTVLKKAPKERIEEMLKTVNCYKSVETFRHGIDFGLYDLLDLVDAAGIDIGITIRMRDGEEITFYPGHNFGKTGGRNGTPHEKRVAKKPYEYENTVYDSRAHPRGAISAANPGATLRYPKGVLGGSELAPDDDDADVRIGATLGPQLPPRHPSGCGSAPTILDITDVIDTDKEPETLCDVKKPGVVDLRVVNGADARKGRAG